MERVFIGLGSNVGRREAMIRAALDWLRKQHGIEVVRCSELEETAPWGDTDQPAFVNAVAQIRTKLSPKQLLDQLKTGERVLGRVERRRWGPREIDMDILLFGDHCVETEDLTIPHAQLAQRAFVLEQLLQLEPTLVHPALGVALAELLRRLPACAFDK